MPLPKEVLDSIAADIETSESALVELEDVLSDMRLAGMDVAKHESECESLTEKVRSLKIFYERQKAKLVG